MHVFLELLLSQPPVFVGSCSESTLRNQNIHILLRNLCLHNISILFAAVIASVEYSHTVYFDDKHRSPHDVPRYVGSYLDSVFLCLNSELHWVYSLQTIQDLLVVEEGLVPLHFGCVPHQIVVDILCWFSHVNFALVVIACQEVR